MSKEKVVINETPPGVFPCVHTEHLVEFRICAKASWDASGRSKEANRVARVNWSCEGADCSFNFREDSMTPTGSYCNDHGDDFDCVYKVTGAVFCSP